MAEALFAIAVILNVAMWAMYSPGDDVTSKQFAVLFLMLMAIWVRGEREAG